MMKDLAIPGHNEIKTVIARLIDQGRLPHAILIHERSGGAGLALANFTVRRLLCAQPNGITPCGECGACQKTNQYVHPDVNYIYPVNLNKSVKKTDDRHSASFFEQWREMNLSNPVPGLLSWYKAIDIERKQGFIGDEESKELRKKLALRSYEGGFRVFVIWHAERMNHSFANKMLKQFEEPTEKTVFILVSDNPAAMLPTVISRVQVFREASFSDEEMIEFLVNSFDIDRQKASEIAFRCEGNLQQAIIEARGDESPWFPVFQNWMRLSYKRDLAGLYSWSLDMSKHSRDEQKAFCDFALQNLDKSFRLNWLPENLPPQGEAVKFYRDFSKFINAANVGGFQELIEEIAVHIERNVYEKLVWFDASIKSIRLIHAGKALVKQMTDQAS
ncbi:MAG: DNA polymerase III subunit delta' [Salibacteraceae bacterium]